MSERPPKLAPILALIALAAGCGYAAHEAFVRSPSANDEWPRAIALARHADRTKAELPAIRERDEAIGLFRDLAGSGPSTVRSRAAMLAGVLLIDNAGTDPVQRRELLAEAADSLRRAVRLDRVNDDAAYDLELLLSRAKASGKSRPRPSKHTRLLHHGRPAGGSVGSGY